MAQTWQMSAMLGHYVATVPAQMRRGPQWFLGSADAVYQNLNLIYDERQGWVLVFGASHVYRMDPQQMLEHHIAHGAGLTVAAVRVPRAEASAFGVIQDGTDSRSRPSARRPASAPGWTDAPDQILASMGNYIFTTAAWVNAVTTKSRVTAAHTTSAEAWCLNSWSVVMQAVTTSH